MKVRVIECQRHELEDTLSYFVAEEQRVYLRVIEIKSISQVMFGNIIITTLFYTI